MVVRVWVGSWDWKGRGKNWGKGGLRSLGGSGFLHNLGRGRRAEGCWAINYKWKISTYQPWTCNMGRKALVRLFLSFPLPNFEPLILLFGDLSIK